MARSARIEIILDTLRGQRGARDLAKEVRQANDALKDNAKQGKDAGRAVDDAGEEMSDAARAAATLDREIAKLNGSLRDMAVAQALGGDFAKQIREQERELRRVTKGRKLIGAEAGAESAVEFSASFASRLGPLLARMPISGPMAGVLGTAAAVASPVIGGAIAGAIIGGAGVGGVAGGLLLASKDARVQAAATALGRNLNARLNLEAGEFVDASLSALTRLEVAVNRVDLDSALRDAARFVTPLVDGIGFAVERVGAGITDLLGDADPVINTIRNGIGQIGDAVGDMFTALSDNGTDAATALGYVFTIVDTSIRAVSATVNGLTETLGFLEKYGLVGAGFLDLIGVKGDDAAAAANKVAGGIREAGGAAETAVHQFVPFNEQIAALADRNLSAAEASLRLRQAIYDATEAIDGKKKVNGDEEQALLAMARATNATTEALDEQGRTVGEATEAHETNRKKLIETAEKMGYTRGEAVKLANQYLAIPKDAKTNVDQPGMKTSRDQTSKYHKQLDNLARRIKTEVNVIGASDAYLKLEKLLVAQQAAKKGISVSAAQSAFNKQERNASGSWHGGGRTGQGGDYEPAGIVHRNEVVLNARTVRKVDRQSPGFLDELHATGQLPGYYAGGRVITAPFNINASATKIMTMAEALSKVAPSFGAWPSSPAAQRGDSGVWRQVVRLINAGPNQGRFGNAYRRGDPKWHGSGRAVDWMGYNMDALASYLAARRPLELIHRTNQRDYAYTRGRNMGSFNRALMNAHRNHIHIAMLNGGWVREPVFGVGRSGRTYSFAENGRPERVLSAGQSGGGGISIGPVTVNVVQPGATARQIGREVSNAIGAQADILIRTQSGG